MRRFALLVAPALAMLALPGAAFAHTKLLSSAPAANATVAKPTKLTLTFSETLVGPLSGIELTMTAMPGMADHPRMPIRGFTIKVEGRTMTAKLPRPLPAGTYELKWHVVSADQHRMENTFNFNVR